MNNNMKITRGEIYLVNLGGNEGTSIQGKMRACIVISNEKANTYSPVIHVVPLTSRCKNNLPTHVVVGTDSGLLQESIAMAEQAQLVSKDMIVRKVGEVNGKVLDKIENSILIQFGLMDKIQAILGFQKIQQTQNLQFARC